MEPKAFPARLMSMAPWLCAVLLALLPAWACAGDFHLSASVDHTQVELGDTIQFTLQLEQDGEMTFQPTVSAPTFDGFSAQGPSQSYSSSWINGASTVVTSWTWELEADKPGRFTLGPFTASGKDASSGDLLRSTNAIVITVNRPKGLNYPLPGSQAAAQPNQEPGPDASSLHGIKPDRGIPWALMAWVFGGFLLLLGLLGWVAQHNSLQVVEEALPADPAQAAIARLDRASRDYLTAADGRVYAVAVGEALRLYLRQRLDMRQGLTLGEAVQTLRARLPHLRSGRASDLRQRLEWLLYAGSEFRPEDRESLDLDARALVRALEAARVLSPNQQALSKILNRMAELWKQGQVKSAWMGMRSAFEEHTRKSWSLGPGPLPRAALARALKPLDAPELLRSLDMLSLSSPPRGAQAETMPARLLRLAQALDAAVQSGGPEPLNTDGEDGKTPENKPGATRARGDGSGSDEEGEA